MRPRCIIPTKSEIVDLGHIVRFYSLVSLTLNRFTYQVISIYFKLTQNFKEISDHMDYYDTGTIFVLLFSRYLWVCLSWKIQSQVVTALEQCKTCCKREISQVIYFSVYNLLHLENKVIIQTLNGFLMGYQNHKMLKLEKVLQIIQCK